MKQTIICLKATTISCLLILLTQNIFGQLSVKAYAKDWMKLDPKADTIAGISLYKAYDFLKGKTSKTVIVAVIDNGIDLEHEDLKNIIWTNKKEIPGNGIDDDNNGFIDDIHGWNFRGSKQGTIVGNEKAGATQIYSAWKNKFEKADTNLLKQNERKEWIVYKKAKSEYLDKISTSKDSMDLNFAYNINYNSANLIDNDADNLVNNKYGTPYFKLSPNLNHGTYVSGIIAAQRNNGIGIDGIAENVLIMPIVASTQVGDERDKDVANAIHYAVNNGAKLINISFSKIYSTNKKLLDEAIQYAERKNVLIIHCAGNDGVNIDSADNYHYPIPLFENGEKATNFITVGWSRPLFDYRLAHPNSCYGKFNVDLFAPGSDIYTTVPNNKYDFEAGSSMSAPVVTGVAAVLLSYFPTLTTKQVKQIILKSVFKTDQLVNKPHTKKQVLFSSLSVTGGIVNAYNAVLLATELTKRNNK